MKLLTHLDCTPYLEFHTIKEEHKVSGIQILNVKLPELTDYLFTKIDPHNNLKDPMTKMNFDILDPEQQELLTAQMMITRYCIHRILTHFKLWNNDPWTFHLDQDYYGEDVEMIYVKPQLAQQIDKYLEQLVNRKAHERVEIVLKLEYGYLIPSVLNKDWQVAKVDPDQLYFSNQSHYKECLDHLDQVENFRNLKSAQVENEAQVSPIQTDQSETADNQSKDESGTQKLENKALRKEQPKPELAVENENPIPKYLEQPVKGPIPKNVYSAMQKINYAQMLGEFPYPRAVTIKNPNGKFKVIDGYHRLAGCSANEQPLIIYCVREDFSGPRQNKN